MDETYFDERVKRLQQISAVVSTLDPAIRSEAFDMLKGYVTGEDVGTPPPKPRAASTRGNRKPTKQSPPKRPATPRAPLVTQP
jgi:hypothetical protein